MKRRRCKLKTAHDPHEWNPAVYPSFGHRAKGKQKAVVVAATYWCTGAVKCAS